MLRTYERGADFDQEEINIWTQSGNIYDAKNDLFIKDGFGAMVITCGIETKLEYLIATAIINDMRSFLENINEGAIYKIGPAFSEDGTAVYCENYIEMLPEELREELLEQEKEFGFSTGGRK